MTAVYLFHSCILLAIKFVRESGGFALAISRDGQFSAEREMHRKQRPDALASPGYKDGDPLFEILSLAVKSHARRIGLSRMGADK